jgi:hypothetical protein
MQTGKEIDENGAKCATETLQRGRRCQDMPYKEMEET